MEFINMNELRKLAESMKNSDYGKYLMQILINETK